MSTLTLLIAAVTTTAVPSINMEEARSQSVERAARRYRIESYDHFRQDRPTYDEYRQAGDALLAAWQAADTPAEHRAMVVDWYLAAMPANGNERLPEQPVIPLPAPVLPPQPADVVPPTLDESRPSTPRVIESTQLETPAESPVHTKPDPVTSRNDQLLEIGGFINTLGRLGFGLLD